MNFLVILSRQGLNQDMHKPQHCKNSTCPNISHIAAVRLEPCPGQGNPDPRLVLAGLCTSPPWPVSTMMGACMVEVRGTAPTLSASLFGFLVSMRAPSVSPVGLRALFSTRAMRADLEEEKKTKRKEKQIPWLKAGDSSIAGTLS